MYSRCALAVNTMAGFTTAVLAEYLLRYDSVTALQGAPLFLQRVHSQHRLNYQ